MRWSEYKLYEKIAKSEISSRFVASDWPELETLARASMRGLCHKVRHNNLAGED